VFAVRALRRPHLLFAAVALALSCFVATACAAKTATPAASGVAFTPGESAPNGTDSGSPLSSGTPDAVSAPPTRSASGFVTGSAPTASGLLTGPPSSADAGTHERLYVVNAHGPGSVSVIDTGRRKVMQTIMLSHPAGDFPFALATGISVNPGGDRAFVTTVGAGLETLDLQSGKVIAVDPALDNSYGISPADSGLAAFVLRVANGDGNGDAPQVIPVDAAGHPRQGITVGNETFNISAIVSAPDGNHVYALLFQGLLVAIDTRTLKVDAQIHLPDTSKTIAITPDGQSAYITVEATPGIVKVDLATGLVSPLIAVGAEPQGIAITPDGRTAYITDGETVIPLDLTNNQAGAAIRLAPTGATLNPDALGGPVVITRDGRWLFAVDPEANAVVPIDIATGHPGPPIAVGPYPLAVALGP
jgi:DNA-binding beta-propeller fold protein YncE